MMNEDAQTTVGDGCDPPHQEVEMSKKQLKKQRKREKFFAMKQERRRRTKQNRKRRLAEMREKGEDVGPKRSILKSNIMKNSACKIKVVIDLSMDEYMTEKDVSSLTIQLQHSYSVNRRSENPMQLYWCGLHGKTLQRLENIGDYKSWDVYVETRNYDEIFPKESLVYLTSESPNILTDLTEDKVYVIGGLVDHNQHKGLCHRIAEEKGIFHAQLPISEYLNMKTRKVLAVNHVFSILLHYTESHDWKEAFLAEIPQRKQACLRQEGEGNSGILDKNLVMDNSSSNGLVHNTEENKLIVNCDMKIAASDEDTSTKNKELEKKGVEIREDKLHVLVSDSSNYEDKEISKKEFSEAFSENHDDEQNVVSEVGS